KNASTVSVFKFTRRYQHVIVLNSRAPVLRSAAIRRALNFSIDRTSIVHNALNDLGIPSSTPIWPDHWALRRDLPSFAFDPQQARALIGTRPVRFTCLVASDSLDERIALEVKRQLALAGIEMAIEAASRDEIQKRAAKGEYEAAVTELISG